MISDLYPKGKYEANTGYLGFLVRMSTNLASI